MTNVWDTKGPSEKQAYASGVSSRDAEVEALRKQLAEFGAGEDTTTMTRKSFAEVLQALADAQIAESENVRARAQYLFDEEKGLRQIETARAERAEAECKAAKELVARQAEDEGLWFVPVTITEDYLQRALRSLHEAVEGRSSSECARAALNPSTAGREG